GPKRPQDRVPLAAMKENWHKALKAPVSERGFGLNEAALAKKATVKDNGHTSEIGHGAVVIAAITSCTNTSNPSVMLAAGLHANKAVERGLQVPPHVKTSLAPGSRVVTDYLDQAGLTEPLAKIGFNTVGYGCTTCIGNSGPLPEPVAKAVTEGDLVAAAVLSGNRNFEGRVHPQVRANYLASPMLVVAFALAGTITGDLTTQPLGYGKKNQPVYLRDIWPSPKEIAETVRKSVTPAMFRSRYADVFTGDRFWKKIKIDPGQTYRWDENSTYVKDPPYFRGMSPKPGAAEDAA